MGTAKQVRWIERTAEKLAVVTFIFFGHRLAIA
jgi:hypothetical protein